nr:transposase [Pseudomonas savastanoi]
MIERRHRYQEWHDFLQADMLRRVVQHIPEKHFRMIRYFGFLANRVCGRQLPRVYEALRMERRGKAQKLYFAQMSKAFLHRDPFSCVLCGARMVYTAAIAGLTVQGLINNAQSIAQLRYVPA